ncbi:hypothetical protein TNCV_322911 [Trichonephila clavipes]|nr:hypothetical protein TNCV_322911 [Trichonephila clavipes]
MARATMFGHSTVQNNKFHYEVLRENASDRSRGGEDLIQLSTDLHRCPTRRVFSGTGLEPVTKQATVRYLYHSATAATTWWRGFDSRYI